LYSEETIERFRKEGRLVFYKKNDGTYNVKLKKYFKVDSTGQAIERRQNIRSILLDFLNSQGTKELNSIFNTIRKFEAPKPVDLIKYILKSYYTNDFIALDFFAGSGTTGQAVLELNKEDGGKRQFILCTINEKDIPEKVTRERLLRVMTGKTSDGKSNFPWIERNKPLGDSLDVYRIESIKNNSREIFNKINVDDYDQKFINEE
jgi:adenine specific DNA methylase Mod